jgi:hypothetical protein
VIEYCWVAAAAVRSCDTPLLLLLLLTGKKQSNYDAAAESRDVVGCV